MTEAVMHLNDLIPRAAWRILHLVAPIERAIARTILARATYRALNELPDEMLGDIGMTRSEILFVVEAIASEGCPFDRAKREQRLVS